MSPLLSVSRTRVPVASLLANLFGGHGRNKIEKPCFVCQITKVRRDGVGVLPTRGSVYGFRTFCSIGDLSAKKCVPCNSKDMRPMIEQNANDLLQKVPGWDLINDTGTLKLQRSWKVKNFTKGLDFFKLVADVAEVEGHHPDLHLVGWNNVKIEIWTHAVGGLTENDFILAAKINQLDVQDLLRKKKVGN